MEEPLTRVMALHALTYCERLFYLEEVEEIRIADNAVYDGRTFHEQLPEYVNVEHLSLESESLGMQGKVDCIRSIHGEWIPYEYKKGHARVQKSGEVWAWPSDEVQVGAYALLLEEYLNKPVEEGRVFYATDHRTVRVPIDVRLRQRVISSIDRAQVLRSSTERPQIAENERLCGRCSLAPVCLPEEERFIEEPGRDTVRLFPEDNDLMDIHVISHGSTVRRAGNTLVVDNKDGQKQAFPIAQIGSVSLHGYNQVTTQTLYMCANRGINLHWFSAGGNYIGSLTNAAGGVQRKLRQFKSLADEEQDIRIARALVAAKLESQLRYVLRLTRGDGKRDEFIRPIEGMREALSKVHRVRSIDELRGYEGLGAKEYFTCFCLLTQGNKPTGMEFKHRNRRPPKDPPNALLSFLYSLLYKDCVQAIIAVGLDPAVGFYHQPRSASYPFGFRFDGAI